MVLQNTGGRITPISIGNSIQLLYFGRTKSKVTAKRATGMLMPVLRKAPNVGCHFKDDTVNVFEQLIGRQIFKILRIDTTEDYEASYTLALLFLFDNESRLLVGIEFEHDTTKANYGTFDDIRNEFEIDYYDPHLNELKSGDKLNDLIGQSINSIKVGQFTQDKYSSDSFTIKIGHYAGVIIEVGDQKLTLYTADKGQEILFNCNQLFPNPSTWILT